MSSTKLRDLQLKELEILKEFIRLCELHHLQYYLAWGSCLGAVRHHGFIPWDDDIDIIMPWKDYERFKQVCKTDLNEKYFYQDSETDKNFFLNFAKLRANDTTLMLDIFSKIDIHWGIGIDIFPLYEYEEDTLPKKDEEEIHLYRKLYYKYAYTKRKFYKPRNIVDFFKIAARCAWYHILYPEHKRLRLIQKFEEAWEQRRGNYLYDLEGIGMTGPLPKHIFQNGIKIPFEDIEVMVPAEYDTYLCAAYGDDYMEIPEGNSDKIYVHENVIVDVNASYKKYK